jgi:ankyrin repeat protein
MKPKGLVWPLLFALLAGGACGLSGVQTEPIFDAASRGDLEKLKSLVRNNPNLVFSKDGEGLTPLIVAVKSKSEF